MMLIIDIQKLGYQLHSEQIRRLEANYVRETNYFRLWF